MSGRVTRGPAKVKPVDAQDTQDAIEGQLSDLRASAGVLASLGGIPELDGYRFALGTEHHRVWSEVTKAARLAARWQGFLAALAEAVMTQQPQTQPYGVVRVDPPGYGAVKKYKITADYRGQAQEAAITAIYRVERPVIVTWPMLLGSAVIYDTPMLVTCYAPAVDAGLPSHWRVF